MSSHLSNASGLRCGSTALLELGPECGRAGHRGRSLTSGDYSPETLPTTSSLPAGAWHSGTWPKGAACPLELGRRGTHRGGRRKSRSGARTPQQPAEAGQGAARLEPGKDAPGGAGGWGARGGVAELAESRAAHSSAHPRSRLPRPGRQPKRRGRAVPSREAVQGGGLLQGSRVG